MAHPSAAFDRASSCLQGMPDVDKLSASLQQLWALAEGAAVRQASVDLGRYEVSETWRLVWRSSLLLLAALLTRWRQYQFVLN